MSESIIVVPCYNEARRLSPEGFESLARNGRLLFVDDGSTDETPGILHGLSLRWRDRVSVLPLSRNVGKAEAVRLGMLAAIEAGADVVGYYDADLATPPYEMMRLMGLLDDGSVEVALAARVGLLGTNIERHPMRHYLGRVFATLASSVILDLRVYDTQCGAKAFRASRMLQSALAEPFHARWAFDVELIGRLMTRGLDRRHFIEMPLRRWSDVPDSKLTLWGAPRMFIELCRIWAALRADRREQALLPAAVPQLDEGL